jgi:hypothetical protein
MQSTDGKLYLGSKDVTTTSLGFNDDGDLVKMSFVS